MTSPFPGMDPYLENHWLDVHARLVVYTADELNQILPDSLVARTEERIAVESDWGPERVYGPDVRVTAAPLSGEPDGAADSELVVGAPLRLVVEMEPITERFIRVIDRAGTLITVIEFLSPTNKRGEGLEAYLAKRRERLRAGVNVVEIDLVRQGNWRAILRPHVCPPEAVSAYRATVRLPPGATALLYAAPLGQRLPDVHAPLRPRDPPAALPLQRLVDRAYSSGRYGQTLDYRQPLDPPLTGADAALAEPLLKSASQG